jgi:hypothetical protein
MNQYDLWLTFILFLLQHHIWSVRLSTGNMFWCLTYHPLSIENEDWIAFSSNTIETALNVRIFG